MKGINYLIVNSIQRSLNIEKHWWRAFSFFLSFFLFFFSSWRCNCFSSTLTHTHTHTHTVEGNLLPSFDSTSQCCIHPLTKVTDSHSLQSFYCLVLSSFFFSFKSLFSSRSLCSQAISLMQLREKETNPIFSSRRRRRWCNRKKKKTLYSSLLTRNDWRWETICLKVNVSLFWLLCNRFMVNSTHRHWKTHDTHAINYIALHLTWSSLIS